MSWSYEYDFIVTPLSDLQNAGKRNSKHSKVPTKERRQYIDLSSLSDYQYNEDMNSQAVEVGESCAIIISNSGTVLHDNESGIEYDINLPLSTIYERASGKDKTLNYFPSGSLNDINSILLNYARILDMDTNTKDNISVTAIAQCFSQKTETGFRGTIVITCNKWDSSPFPKPEIQAWAVVIDEIMLQRPVKSRSERIAIIVDSELDSLPAYNAQQKPLTSNLYLPSNFSLIYASADSGSEFLANKLIKLCDKHAAKILNA